MFNSVSWSISDRNARLDLKTSISNQVTNMIKEDRVKEKIKKRTNG